MSDSAPPPPPPDNQGGATPPPAAPPPPPPASPYGAAPPPPASPYGAAPPPPPGAVTGAQPGQLLERFVARLIDGILVGIVGAVIGLVLGRALGGFVGSALSAVVTAAIYLGYFAYLESDRGQTLGKQIMGLRVVGASGSGHPTMEEAVKRNAWTALGVLGIVPVLGTFVGGLLQLAALILIVVTINADTVRRQSWFDTFAGGTQVLKD